MDGLIFAAFFFPIISCTSILLNYSAFLFSLWVGFGSFIGEVVGDSALCKYVFPSWITKLLITMLNNPPFKAYGSLLYPLLLNVTHVTTVLGTYSLGTLLYYGKGWRFNQPLKGGVRFVFLQCFLWSVFAVALCLPWLSFQSFGLMTYFGAVESSVEDNSSFGGLLVCSAALGVMSQLLVLVALMVFENRRNLKPSSFDSFETGKWNWKRMFGEASGGVWWIFLVLQISMAMYALLVAVLADKTIHNSTIQSLMAVVSVGVLAAALALTNIVGGKWRYGATRYHVLMPFRGGCIYVGLQGLGWMLFSLALLTAVVCIREVWFLDQYYVHQRSLLAMSGVMGFFAELFVAVSLLFFDPSKAGDSLYLEQLKTIETLGQRYSSHEFLSDRKRRMFALKSPKADRDTKAQETWVIERIIGQRRHATIKNATEFLVQWCSPRRYSEWILEPGLFGLVGRGEAIAAVDKYAKEKRLLDTFSDSPNCVDESHPSQYVSKGINALKARRRKCSSVEPNSLSSDSSLEQWEECEDEVGNIFYHCLNTGKTVRHVDL